MFREVAKSDKTHHEDHEEKENKLRVLHDLRDENISQKVSFTSIALPIPDRKINLINPERLLNLFEFIQIGFCNFVVRGDNH